MARASCLRYRQHSKSIVLRQDLLGICTGQHAPALLLGQMIYWHEVKIDSSKQAEITNKKLIASGKRPTQDTGLWVWKTAEEAQDELMGIIGLNRVRDAFKWLVQQDYLEIRSNPLDAFDKTKQYRANIEVIQAAIEALPVLTDAPELTSRSIDINGSDDSNESSDLSVQVDGSTSDNGCIREHISENTAVITADIDTLPDTVDPASMSNGMSSPTAKGNEPKRPRPLTKTQRDLKAKFTPDQQESFDILRSEGIDEWKSIELAAAWSVGHVRFCLDGMNHTENVVDRAGFLIRAIENKQFLMPNSGLATTAAEERNAEQKRRSRVASATLEKAASTPQSDQTTSPAASAPRSPRKSPETASAVPIVTPEKSSAMNWVSESLTDSEQKALLESVHQRLRAEHRQVFHATTAERDAAYIAAAREAGWDGMS